MRDSYDRQRNTWRRLARRTGWCLAACCAALIAGGAIAQQSTGQSAAPKRPRIALALAGGGAKGGAHIGVLKVLEELRVPVDCIAGTSMGSLVGGGYASGMTAAEIEEFVRGVDWKSVVGGVGSRPLQPVEQKRYNDQSGIELGLKGGRVLAPRGLIASSRIEDVLRSFVAKSRSVADFDRLPIPYRAVATDMLTGNMVVLSHGDIATAMRASMALPGIFAPVILDPYVLSDGYVVRNLPIDVAREMCGDVVIAVNLAKRTVTAQDLSGPASLISRSSDIMMEANERIELQTLTDRDVRIDVDTRDVTGGDFERTPETIAFGEEAARAAAPRLAALSVSPAEYAAWRHRVSVSQDIKIKIADVQFEGLKHVNAEYLRGMTKVRAGDTVDVAAISRDAAQLAALEDIEGVEYRLSGDPNNPTLVWQPTEKQIGPDYLRPGLGLYAGGGGELRFEISVEYVRRWLNSYGAQWRNKVEVGTTTFLGTSLYQPLDTAQIFFVEPGLGAGRSLEDLYNDYNRVARYFFNDAGGQLDAGVNLGTRSQLRVGYWADRRQTEVDIGPTLLPTGAFTDAGIASAVFYDSRDAATYGTRGTAAEIDYLRSDSSLGANRDWEVVEAAVRQALRVGRAAVWLTAAGGSDLGSALPADRAFSLGGPQSFAGYAPGEVRAGRYWTLQSNVLWRVADILPIVNQTLYGGVGLEGGHVWERVDPVPDGDLYGFSLYLGGRTPLGTVTLGVGRATGSWAGWLTLGTPVGKGSILDHPLFR
jgi:NTE family protein